MIRFFLTVILGIVAFLMTAQTVLFIWAMLTAFKVVK